METLRYWEAEGLVSPRRNSGQRVYDQRTMNALHVLSTMRNAGFSLAEVRLLMRIKTDAPPADLVRRARQAIAELNTRLDERERALRRSRELLHQWSSALDGSGY